MSATSPDRAGPAADEEVFVFPASFAQQRFWMLEQLEPGGAAYTIPIALRLEGPFDVPAFSAALAAVVERHEALRTVFEAQDGEPVQVVLPRLSVPVPVTDIGQLAAEEQEARVRAAAAAEANGAFDLEHGPLIRAAVLRLGATTHVLLVTLHHIVADGWSVGVLFSELGRLYGERIGGARAELAPLPLQYADYALWQRRTLEGPALDGHLEHWRSVLAGRLPALELPADRPRPPIQTYAGGRVATIIPPATAEAVHDLAARSGATPFMTYLAAYQLLLHRHSGQDDILVGSPIAGRTRSEVEPLIGLFINTLVHRADFSADPSFSALLARTRDAATAAYAHQDLPFERLVDALQPGRDRSRTPVFQAAFLMGAVGTGELNLPGLSASAVDAGKLAAKFDITLSLTERAGSLRASLEYNSDLFDQGTAERLLERFVTLLGSAVRTPDAPVSALPMLSVAERRTVTETWNRTTRPQPDNATVTALFAGQVAIRRDALAVTANGAAMTYGELDTKAEQLARRLVAAGVRRGELIGVCTGRSADLLVALLGVLRAGAAYVPLDPEFPAQRLAYMVEDAGLVRAVVDDAGARTLAGLLPGLIGVAGGEPSADIGALPDVAPDDLAYVIYTSGSTGRPKGVEIAHRALVNLLAAMHERPGLGVDDILLAVTTLSFDIAALELFGPVTVGGTVVVADRDTARSAPDLAALLERSGATVMQATPATWRMLLADGWPGRRSLRAWCGGEALPPEVATALVPRCGELWNMYGPTETTVWSTVNRIAGPGDAASIGAAIANTRLYVVDRRGEPVPIGVPGELCIGGLGVARGYRRRPDLTADRFTADRFSATEGRVYRTGDLVRWLANGTLQFVGRLDHQVKVRGFRIELGEIESVLARQSGVAQAVAVARPGPDGEQQLVAYVVPSPEATVAPGELAQALRAALPAYMVPSAYVALDALPLTPNGKVDRLALPDPTGEASVAAQFEMPRTAGEEVVVEAWKQVLRRDRVSVQDDFFALGGHSLTAARLSAELGRLFGVAVPLRVLFEETTPASQAAWLAAAGALGADEDMADVLAELDAMTDEEARLLLSSPIQEPS